MAVQKSYETLLNDYITAFQGAFPGVDISQGSLEYAKGAAISALVYGLYKELDAIDRNNLPDTADSAGLVAWARNLPVTVNPGDSEATILNNILDFLQSPPSGGTLKDYERWAKAANPDHVTTAKAYENADAQGLGSVDIVISDDSSTGDGAAGDELRAMVYDYILTQQPAGSYYRRVLSIERVLQDVDITVTGPCDLEAAMSQITAYLNTLECNETLFITQLQAITIANGAVNAVVNTPSADVVPTTKQKRIRPGTAVNVHA